MCSARHLRAVLLGSVALFLPLVPAPAIGQSLPAGCIPSVATPGASVSCVAAAPSTVDGITATVDDLTISIGTGATPTAVVNSSGTGISMTGSGEQSLTIENGSSVTGGAGAGVSINGQPASADVSVTSSGSVSGSTTGIEVINGGVYGTTVQSQDATGSNGHGIYVSTYGNGLSVTSTGTASGTTSGITVRNSGLGNLFVSANNASASAGDGIYALGFAGAGDLTVTTTGTVSGSQNGVNIVNFGSGPVDLTVANVTGQGNNGVMVYGGANSGAITITGTSSITGSQDGVSVTNFGSGTTTVSVVNATGTGRHGIYVSPQYSSGDVSITSTGTVKGAQDGVSVANNTGDALSVSVADVVATSGNGVYAFNVTGTSLSVTATGTVTAGDKGVYAYNYGVGATTVTVNSVSGGKIGVSAGSQNGPSLEVTATGSVYGGEEGIVAYLAGPGTVSISATDTKGGTKDGIYAFNTYNASSMSITSTGTAEGGRRGIHANHYGSGALTISANNVIGSSRDGLLVNTGSGVTTADIAVSGSVTGAENGINVQHQGNGALTVQANDTTASAGAGINAASAGAGVSITSTGHAVGTTQGIYLNHTGTGVSDIIAVDVSASAGVGIYSTNTVAASNVSITSTGTVSGYGDGVRAYQWGSGTFDISVSNVTSQTGDGVFAFGRSSSGAISVTSTGSVVGGDDGITVINYGNSTTTVETVDVTGQGRHGIFVLPRFSTGAVSITSTGTVSGAVDGVNVANYTPSSLTVMTHNVSATTGQGIYAFNISGKDLTVTSTGTITAGDKGVYAFNYSISGDTTVTVHNVTAGKIGLSVGSAYGPTVTVTSTGQVTGGEFGIVAYQGDLGSITVTANDTSGGEKDGIYTLNTGNASTTTITSTGTAYGVRRGIQAAHYGQGALTITSNNATGAERDAILGYSSANGTSLSIVSTGLASGGEDGIDAQLFGNNALSIQSNNASGASGSGISAYNSANGTSLTIVSSGTATGTVAGISATNLGSGPTTITVNSASGTASGGDGISVTGASGAVQITTSGQVSGLDAGIAADATGGVTVSILSGSQVSGGGNSVRLGNANDLLMLAGTNPLVGTADGGGGTDDEVLLMATGSEDDNFENFETLTMRGDVWSLSGTSAFDLTNIETGLLSVNGTLESDQIFVFNGATLGGNASLIGDVTNSGTVAPGNSIGTIAITGNYTQTSSGNLDIEVDHAGNTDLLTVTGTVSLAGTLTVSNLFSPGNDVAGTETIVTSGGGITGTFDAIEEIGVATSVLVTASEVELTYGSIPDNTEAVAARQVTFSEYFRFMEETEFGFENGYSQNQSGSVQPSDPLNRFWVTALGTTGSRDGTAKLESYDFDSAGLAFGAGRQINETWVVGLSGGYAQSWTRTPSNAGKSQTTSYMLGGHAKGVFGQIEQAFTIAAGIDHERLSRRVVVNDSLRTGTGKPWGASFAVRSETSYKHELADETWVQPGVFAAYVGSYRHGYTESGLGQFGLVVDDDFYSSLRLGANVRLKASRPIPNTDAGKFWTELRLGLEQEVALDGRGTNARFAGFGNSFELPGDERSETVLSFGTNLQAQLTKNAKAYARYEGRFGTESQSHLFGGGFKVTW